MRNEPNARQRTQRTACVLGLSIVLVGCQPHLDADQPSKHRVRTPVLPNEPPSSSDAVVEVPDFHHVPHWTQGQTLYLPVYSGVFVVNEKRPLELSVTVSIRNTANTALSVDRLEYVGTKGRLLEKVLESPLVIGPLESRDYVVRQDDKRGGTGANFIVAWTANQPISPPVVQAVNIYLAGNHSFGFVTDAIELAAGYTPKPKQGDGD